MKKRYTSYTPPPEPVYQAAKRKEKCTKALNYLRLLAADSKDVDLQIALEHLIAYKRKLDTP